MRKAKKINFNPSVPQFSARELENIIFAFHHLLDFLAPKESEDYDITRASILKELDLAERNYIGLKLKNKELYQELLSFRLKFEEIDRIKKGV